MNSKLTGQLTSLKQEKLSLSNKLETAEKQITQKQLELNKKQANLDSLSTLQTKTKRENTQLQKDCDTLQKQNKTLTDERQELKKMNTDLENENKAHVRFAQTNIDCNPMAEELASKRNENGKLRSDVLEKDEIIATLKGQLDEITDPKTAAKNQAVAKLKTQVSGLEDQVNQLQGELRKAEVNLNVAKADYEAEKELNRFLVRRANKADDALESTMQQSQTPTEETASRSPKPLPQTGNQILDPHPIENLGAKKRSERDFCFYEFFQVGSCPFPRCMFNHTIPEEEKINQQARDKMNKLKSERQRRNQRPINASRPKEVCETVFKNGPNSCTTDCPCEHNLDFERIRNGVCHDYVLKQCRRRDKCWFSHQVPESMKIDDNVIKSAEKFTRIRAQKHELQQNREGKINPQKVGTAPQEHSIHYNNYSLNLQQSGEPHVSPTSLIQTTAAVSTPRVSQSSPIQ